MKWFTYQCVRPVIGSNLEFDVSSNHHKVCLKTKGRFQITFDTIHTPTHTRIQMYKLKVMRHVLFLMRQFKMIV